MSEKLTYEELAREVKKLRQLLRDLEWCGEALDGTAPACVHCMSPESEGHHEGCQLAAALEGS